MRGIVAYVRLALLAAVMAAGVTSGVSSVVGAQSSEVRVRVCSTDSQPTITVSSPQSDTVVESRSLIISGSAERITQIEVSIDNNYVRTVALPSNVSTFVTNVSLTPGTQTIRLEAQPLCPGHSIASRTLVITYRQSQTPQPDQPRHPGQPSLPTRPPSPGATIPTVSNPNVVSPGGGNVVSPGDNPDEDDSVDESSSVGAGVFTSWISNLLGSFDPNGEYGWRNWRLVSRETGQQLPASHIGWWALVVIGLIAAALGRFMVWFIGPLRRAEPAVQRGIDTGIRLGGAALVILGLVGVLWLV